MGVSNRLFGRMKDHDALWLHVRCRRCGAKVRVRIDLYNDLSQLEEEGGYILRKEIMDSTCCQLMHAELHFDEQRQITSQTIIGGEFIAADEYGKP